jgi:hypothetical protein
MRIRALTDVEEKGKGSKAREKRGKFIDKQRRQTFFSAKQPGDSSGAPTTPSKDRYGAVTYIRGSWRIYYYCRYKIGTFRFINHTKLRSHCPPSPEPLSPRGRHQHFPFPSPTPQIVIKSLHIRGLKRINISYFYYFC